MKKKWKWDIYLVELMYYILILEKFIFCLQTYTVLAILNLKYIFWLYLDAVLLCLFLLVCYSVSRSKNWKFFLKWSRFDVILFVSLIKFNNSFYLFIIKNLEQQLLIFNLIYFFTLIIIKSMKMFRTEFNEM